MPTAPRCALRREQLMHACRENGAELISTHWPPVVEHPAVGVVLIATPDDEHYRPELACAEAGKHLICEKQVVRTTAEVEAIWRAYRDGGIGHFVPFWIRYEAPPKRAKTLIAGGAVGARALVQLPPPHAAQRRERVRLARRRGAVSTAGEVADLGVHMIDVVCWMLGAGPLPVLAHDQVRWRRASRTPGCWTCWRRPPVTEAAESRRPTTWDHGTVLVELADGIAPGY